MKFLDQAKVYIRSGNGGAGCISFRREKYVEFGGPDGGDGGKGGDVIIECVDGLNTLIDYRYQQHFKAKTGAHGMGQNRSGRAGEDAILRVPRGTQIFAEDNATLIADMMQTGDRMTIARGGNGGFGNTHFKGPVNRAPRHANPGQEGYEAWIWLRLKLIADIGLIGLPNAGKSTLLSTLSRATPKIADYPFTTLHPHLGMVYARAREFIMADIPGLIAGASEGAGLGHRFLGHVERCSAILHVIDGLEEDIAHAYSTIRHELEAYDAALGTKPEIIALTKCDSVPADIMAEKQAILQDISGSKIESISAVTKQGLPSLLDRLLGQIDNIDGLEDIPSQTRWSPL